MNTLKRFKNYILLTLVELIFKPRWIVNSDNEFGFKIRGTQFYYYKWSEPIICFDKDDKYRLIKKREFGETIQN